MDNKVVYNNNQEVFNKVYTHLLTQNKKSRLDDEFCAYKATDGLQCAFGCLIPDEFYSPEMEAHPIFDLFVMSKPLKMMFAHDCELSLVEALQVVHDDYDPDQWLEELHVVAATYKLIVPELSND